MVGIAPNGDILYFSYVWGERASDQKITISDRFINLVEKGDLILADRKFAIIDVVFQKQAVLEIPPPGQVPD